MRKALLRLSFGVILLLGPISDPLFPLLGSGRNSCLGIIDCGQLLCVRRRHSRLSYRPNLLGRESRNPDVPVSLCCILNRYTKNPKRIISKRLHSACHVDCSAKPKRKVLLGNSKSLRRASLSLTEMKLNILNFQCRRLSVCGESAGELSDRLDKLVCKLQENLYTQDCFPVQKKKQAISQNSSSTLLVNRSRNNTRHRERRGSVLARESHWGG